MKLLCNIVFTGITLLWLVSGCSKTNTVGQAGDLQTSDVKSRLNDFDQGKLSLEEITGIEKWGKEWPVQLLAYYESHKKEVTPKMKIAISRCYAGFKRFSESAELAQQYVNVYSNDARGWDILAGARIAGGSLNEGFVAGTNALRLGREANMAGIAITALKLEQFEVFEKNMLPRMLVIKDAGNAVNFTEEDRLEIVNVLVNYSLMRDKKEIFIRALENLTLTPAITNYSDLVENIQAGCNAFGTQETVKICKQLSLTDGGQNSKN